MTVTQQPTVASGIATLTVTRGVAGTIAAPHVANSFILPSPQPSDFEVYLTQKGALSGNTSAGSNVISGLPSTTNLTVGESVAGAGIPSDATIATISSLTSITISANASQNGTNIPLTFGGLYEASLYNLDWMAQSASVPPLGWVTFNMPSDVEQVALEGGPANNIIQADSSVTRDMFLYGGQGNNTLIGGSGNDTLVGGSGE